MNRSRSFENPAGLRERAVGALLVFALVALAYRLLLSGIRVDDSRRYVLELGTGSFAWDLAHVWLEPLALLLYKAPFLPFHALGIERGLEMLNVFSMAIGAAVFFDTLRLLGHGAARAGLATLLVVGSFNMIVLVPTAHVKPMMIPALALSLRHAVLWEAQAARGQVGYARAVASALWLGVGCNLLVSLLPMGLYVGLFMMLRARQAGADSRRTLGLGLAYGGALALSGATLLVLAWLVASASQTAQAHSFTSFVLDGLRAKEEVKVVINSWKEVPFRFIYSLTANFAFLPTLGALGRARLSGLLGDLSPYYLSLSWQGALALLTAGCLAALAAVGFAALRRGGPTLATALGFVLGAATFALYYNLNDPEHWFQFTLPLAFIAVHARRRWLDVLAFGVWLPLLLVVNLSGYGIPKAAFEMQTRQQAFVSALGEEGLAVGFASYPGEPDTALLHADKILRNEDNPDHGVRRFNIDLRMDREAKGHADVALQMMDDDIRAAFARGGRVLVFRLLDDTDWRGPMMLMAQQGLTHARLKQHFADHYSVSGPLQVAGFPAWEVRPKGAP